MLLCCFPCWIASFSVSFGVVRWHVVPVCLVEVVWGVRASSFTVLGFWFCLVWWLGEFAVVFGGFDGDDVVSCGCSW